MIPVSTCYAWCLNCGQSFEAAEFDSRWRCIYCDAPAQRLIASATPIRPAVINGSPVVYSVLVRKADKPHYVSLAIPQAVRRREFRETRTTDGGKRSPRPRATTTPWRGIQNVPLVELRSDECRFPVTDERPYLFCGSHAVPGCSYCAEHTGIVYVARVTSSTARACVCSPVMRTRSSVT